MCPLGADSGIPVCRTGHWPWGWIEDRVLNPSFLVESVNGNMPSCAWEISEGPLGGNTVGQHKAKGFLRYNWTLHLWNSVAREGASNPCFLLKVFSSLTNHLIMNFSKPCFICLQHEFSALAYYHREVQEGRKWSRQSGLRKDNANTATGEGGPQLEREEVWFGDWKH